MTTHTLEPAARRLAGLAATDGRTYPLVSARVSAHAEGGIARTTLTQVFDNPHDEALEVVYTLPLPADGAVLGYTIRLGDKVIRGEIEPREKAAAAYREAVYQGRTAGLLEQDRADTFQQRLGNLPPRTRAEVEIEVLQPLAFLSGLNGQSPQWEYRFPTVVGVRYEGAPGRVPDAGRLDVDRDADGAIPTRVEFVLAIADATERATTAFSPSHAVDVAVDPAGAAVRFRQGERLDRDIAVRWTACGSEVGVRMVEGRGLAGDEGRYGLVTIVPPAIPALTFRRDLTLLIDASGSMSGFPLQCAKRVAAALLKSLEPGDRFEILSFANEPRRLTRGLEDWSEGSLERALHGLGGLTAGGGTEMQRGIEEALRPLREGAQRQVVLLTDGYIGFEHEILGRITRTLPAGCRLHAVGIGSAPNRTLIHGAARAGRGAEFVVSDDTGAEEAAARLLAATARPVLTDLVVRGSAVRMLAPARPCDVFAGRPLVLTAELETGGGRLEVEGRLAGSDEPWRWRLDLPAVGTEGLVATPLPIGALHGREAIADLEQELAAGGDLEAVNARIESRGMRHRITSTRTSLVAIAEEPAVDPKQPRRRERLAVELPAGVSAEGAGLMAGGGFAGAVGLHSFADAMPAAHANRRAMSLTSIFERFRGVPLLGKAPEVSWELSPATLVRRDGELLVVEFAVPGAGFHLPSGAVEVLVDGSPVGQATVEVEGSSPAGPHPQGVLVRLALRFDWSRSWAPGRALVLAWRGRVGGPDGAQLPFRLPVAMEGAEPA